MSKRSVLARVDAVWRREEVVVVHEDDADPAIRVKADVHHVEERAVLRTGRARRADLTAVIDPVIDDPSGDAERYAPDQRQSVGDDVDVRVPVSLVRAVV